jgi:hypothetical protein
MRCSRRAGSKFATSHDINKSYSFTGYLYDIYVTPDGKKTIVVMVRSG